MAQLDSASDSDSEGRRFESYRVGQNHQLPSGVGGFSYPWIRPIPKEVRDVGSHTACGITERSGVTLSGRPKNANSTWGWCFSFSLPRIHSLPFNYSCIFIPLSPVFVNKNFKKIAKKVLTNSFFSATIGASFLFPKAFEQRTVPIGSRSQRVAVWCEATAMIWRIPFASRALKSSRRYRVRPLHRGVLA